MPYPVDEQHVLVAEVALGRRLPARLRARLLRDNGGDAVSGDEGWLLFPVWDPTNFRTIRKTTNQMVNEQEAARSWKGFPPEAIAVGDSHSGDLLIVRALSAEIERWDQETAVTGSLDSLRL